MEAAHGSLLLVAESGGNDRDVSPNP